MYFYVVLNITEYCFLSISKETNYTYRFLSIGLSTSIISKENCINSYLKCWKVACGKWGCKLPFTSTLNIQYMFSGSPLSTSTLCFFHPVPSFISFYDLKHCGGPCVFPNISLMGTLPPTRSTEDFAPSKKPNSRSPKQSLQQRTSTLLHLQETVRRIRPIS